MLHPNIHIHILHLHKHHIISPESFGLVGIEAKKSQTQGEHFDKLCKKYDPHNAQNSPVTISVRFDAKLAVSGSTVQLGMSL